MSKNKKSDRAKTAPKETDDWMMLIHNVYLLNIILNDGAVDAVFPPSNEPLTAEIEIGAEFIQRTKNFFTVLCRSGITLSNESGPVLVSGSNHILVYRHHPDIKTKVALLRKFAQKNAPYHAWPYIRERYSSVTQQAGFTPYMIPPLVIAGGEFHVKGVKLTKPKGLKAYVKQMLSGSDTA